jgi:MFS family permease
MSLLSPLRNRTYRHLFSAQVVALVGTGLLTVALGLLAFDLAGGSAGRVLANVLTIKILIYVVFSPVITALAANWRTKPVLVGADLVRAAVALTLPLIGEEWQLYVAIGVLQAASATFTPTFQAAIPRILPDEEQYTRALSLSRLAYDLEQMASPVLAAALLVVMGYTHLFLGTVVGFVASAGLVLTASLLSAPASSASQTGFLERAQRGSRIMVRQRPLRAVLWLNLAVAAPMAMVMVNTVVIVRHELGMGEPALAWTLAIFGLGSMAVAFALPAVLAKIRDGQVLLPAAALGSLVLVVLAIESSRTYLTVALAWLILGAALSAMQTPIGRIIRRNADDNDLPYIFAAQFSLSHACYLITYPVAGWVGDGAGLGAATAVLAGLAILGTAMAAWTWPRARVAV